MADEPKRPGPKGPRNDHDAETPAYRIIYGVFGSLAEFCRATKTPPGTAHLWLTNGLIPAHRQPKVRRNAAAAGVEIPAHLFVPDPEAEAA
jgi:hypothetical protein